MKNKGKRILALIGAALLAGFGIAALIFALMDAPWAYQAFKACMALALTLPILLYGYLLIAKVLAGRGVPKDTDNLDKHTKEKTND